MIRRAILDKNVRVPDDAVIGYDLAHDRLTHHVTGERHRSDRRQSQPD